MTTKKENTQSKPGTNIVPGNTTTGKPGTTPGATPGSETPGTTPGSDAANVKISIEKRVKVKFLLSGSGFGYGLFAGDESDITLSEFKRLEKLNVVSKID